MVALTSSVAAGSGVGLAGGLLNCTVQGMFSAALGGIACTPQRAAVYGASGAFFGAVGGISGYGVSQELGPMTTQGGNPWAWGLNQWMIGCIKAATSQVIQ